MDVAVTIPVTALTGGSGEPAVSADGRWGIPTSWAIDEFMRSDTFWHRMILDPVTNDVLASEYIGRYAPEVLTRALLFTYQVCQAPSVADRPAHATSTIELPGPTDQPRAVICGHCAGDTTT